MVMAIGLENITAGEAMDIIKAKEINASDITEVAIADKWFIALIQRHQHR